MNPINHKEPQVPPNGTVRKAIKVPSLSTTVATSPIGSHDELRSN